MGQRVGFMLLFLLCARKSSWDAFGVFQTLAVGQNQVIGKSVQAVVEGFTLHKKLLGGKGHEYGGTAGGEAPLNGDLVEAQGEGGH